MKSALVLLALCIFTATSFAQEHPALTAQPNSVYVGADGKFESAPDTAVIQFNISVQDNTAPMTKGEMQDQRRQQKQEEKAAKSDAKAQMDEAKAAKEKAKALKQENKSTNATEKANSPQ